MIVLASVLFVLLVLLVIEIYHCYHLNKDEDDYTRF